MAWIRYINVYSNDGNTQLLSSTYSGSGTLYVSVASNGICCYTSAGHLPKLFNITYTDEIAGLATSSGSSTPTYSVGEIFTPSVQSINLYAVPRTASYTNYSKISTTNKLQVESAIRDGNGKQIDTNYVKIKDIYEVGGIYISASAESPASKFGGTWFQLKNRFLVGAGDTYPACQYGGESTHTLTVDEMPSHTHTLPVKFGWGSGPSNTGPRTDSNNPGTDWYTAMNSTGGGQAHNNIPPYYAVYIWIRVS